MHTASRRPPAVRFTPLACDLLLPGGIAGIGTTRRLLARRPGVKVIALTALVDEARMMGVLWAGALGYGRKDAEPEVLLAAVRVAGGQPYIDPGVSRQLVRAGAPSDDLTTWEVLRQLVPGRSNREIAASLAIGNRAATPCSITQRIE